MDFTEQQRKQLEDIKQWAEVSSLKPRCEQFKVELENLKTNRKRCLEEKEQLVARLEGDVLERMEKAIQEEETFRQKLEYIKKSANEYQDNKYSQFSVKNICLLLGYQISKCLLLLEKINFQNTTEYENGCHATYNELKELYEFVEEHSEHQEFAEIRSFLHSSQDLRGLLDNLKKLCCKKNT